MFWDGKVYTHHMIYWYLNLVDSAEVGLASSVISAPGIKCVHLSTVSSTLWIVRGSAKLGVPEIVK